MSEKKRAYLYRVATAVTPVLVGYGVVSESEASLWVGLVGAVLSVGGHALASKNTPLKPAPVSDSH